MARPFKGIIHGDTGTGKSELSKTLSYVCRTLYLCFDMSAPHVLQGRGAAPHIELPIQNDSIIREITSFEQIREARNWLLGKGKGVVGGVVLDSIGQGVSSRRVEVSGSNIDHIVKVKNYTWGQIKEEYRLFTDCVMRIPDLHALLIAGSRRTADSIEPGPFDPDTNQYRNYTIVPAIETGLRDEIGYYCTDMGYCYKAGSRSDVHYFITFSRVGIDTKLTGPNKIIDMENPTFEKILAVINKE